MTMSNFATPVRFGSNLCGTLHLPDDRCEPSRGVAAIIEQAMSVVVASVLAARAASGAMGTVVFGIAAWVGPNRLFGVVKSPRKTSKKQTPDVAKLCVTLAPRRAFRADQGSGRADDQCDQWAQKQNDAAD